MKSIISTLAVIALMGAAAPTAFTHSKTISTHVITPVPACPPDSTDVCGGPTPDDAGRTITVGDGLR